MPKQIRQGGNFDEVGPRFQPVTNVASDDGLRPHLKFQVDHLRAGLPMVLAGMSWFPECPKLLLFPASLPSSSLPSLPSIHISSTIIATVTLVSLEKEKKQVRVLGSAQQSAAPFFANSPFSSIPSTPFLLPTCGHSNFYIYPWPLPPAAVFIIAACLLSCFVVRLTRPIRLSVYSPSSGEA